MDIYGNVGQAICIVIGGKKHYMIWQTIEDGNDRLYREKDFLVFNTSDDLRKWAQKTGFTIQEIEVVFYNFDQILMGILSKNFCENMSYSDYRMILDHWNLLEDMTRTLGLRLAGKNIKEKKRIQILYEKIFFRYDMFGYGKSLNVNKPARLKLGERLALVGFLTENFAKISKNSNISFPLVDARFFLKK